MLRLMWAADDYLGLVLYRLRTSLTARRIPILPRILRIICSALYGIRTGEQVVMMAGIYIPHGMVVLDGFVHVGDRCVLCPWVTLGVLEGEVIGPELGSAVFVGTGAKILGHVKVGNGAHIGANAVVLEDVPPHATVVGIPARAVGTAPEADENTI